MKNFHQLVPFVHCVIFNHITLWFADTLCHGWCNFGGALGLFADSIQSSAHSFVKIWSTTCNACYQKMLTLYLGFLRE